MLKLVLFLSVIATAVLLVNGDVSADCELSSPKRIHAYHDDGGLHVKFGRAGNDKVTVCYKVRARLWADKDWKTLSSCTTSKNIKYKKSDIFDKFDMTKAMYTQAVFTVMVRAECIANSGEKTNWKGRDRANRSYYYPKCDMKDDQVAVTLSYDDTLQSQLDNGIPALKAHNFQATFYVNDIAEKEEWHHLMDDGHEIGSHTFQHPCPRADWTEPNDASQDYDLERMAAELDASIEVIKGLGEAEPLTFAYPCGYTKVGGDDGEPESYVPLVKDRFAFARGAEGCSIQDVNSDPYNVLTCFYTDVNGGYSPAKTILDRATAGQWVSLGFHGIGGDHLVISVASHENILQHLDDNRDHFYVDTYRNIARCMWKKRRNL